MQLSTFERTIATIIVAILLVLLFSCTSPKGESPLLEGIHREAINQNIWLVALLSLSGSYEIKDSKINEILVQEAIKKDRFITCIQYKDFETCWKEYYPVRTSGNHY